MYIRLSIESQVGILNAASLLVERLIGGLLILNLVCIHKSQLMCKCRSERDSPQLFTNYCLLSSHKAHT